MQWSSPVLAMWRRLRRWPCGGWLFTRAVCLKAPYFASIAPRILQLEPALCVGTIRRHRRITNHLGTIHAIALCNLAELVGGLMTDVSIPPDMRWIPRGMQVRYLKKALGTLTATAKPAQPFRSADAGYEAAVAVTVVDARGEAVFDTVIAMWVSPRPRA
ncbi:hotdog fold domain-containing protein [Frateuria defendens]|uniref:hotdog fold domain-containing protein n=1 Tax=Frateuria defendens TaxID=2219559 RepID=UPI00066FE928|nr:hotdog fold domain-containing protein [Frateuria defendens]